MHPWPLPKVHPAHPSARETAAWSVLRTTQGRPRLSRVPADRLVAAPRPSRPRTLVPSPGGTTQGLRLCGAAPERRIQPPGADFSTARGPQVGPRSKSWRRLCLLVNGRRIGRAAGMQAGLGDHLGRAATEMTVATTAGVQRHPTSDGRVRMTLLLDPCHKGRPP